MAEFETKAGSTTPTPRAAPASLPMGRSSRDGSRADPNRADSLPTGLQQSIDYQEGGKDAESDDFDVNAAIQELRVFHKYATPERVSSLQSCTTLA